MMIKIERKRDVVLLSSAMVASIPVCIMCSWMVGLAMVGATECITDVIEQIQNVRGRELL